MLQQQPVVRASRAVRGEGVDDGAEWRHPQRRAATAEPKASCPNPATGSLGPPISDQAPVSSAQPLLPPLSPRLRRIMTRVSSTFSHAPLCKLMRDFRDKRGSEVSNGDRHAIVHRRRSSNSEVLIPLQLKRWQAVGCSSARGSPEKLRCTVIILGCHTIV